MPQTIKIAPQNSILAISDVNGGVVPEWLDGQPILSTPSCITFSCLAFMDGKTKVTLGRTNEVDPGGIPAFDGELETPNRVVIIFTIEHETLMREPVSGRLMRIRIWVNHPTEPDEVIIGLG